VFHPSDHFCGPPLDPPQQVYYCLVKVELWGRHLAELIFFTSNKTVEELIPSNGSSNVLLCYEFKNESKETAQFLEVQKHHTQWDYAQDISDNICSLGCPSTRVSKNNFQELSVSWLKPMQSFISTTNFIKRESNWTEEKLKKTLHFILAVDMWTMPLCQHTFEFVVFRVSWEERVWKKFGESEASILGSVLNIVPYRWLQLLHEFWTGCSQLLNNFIPLINIWTSVVKENKMQTGQSPDISVWVISGNPQRCLTAFITSLQSLAFFIIVLPGRMACNGQNSHSYTYLRALRNPKTTTTMGKHTASSLWDNTCYHFYF